jgi:uncharacterized protein (DUF697 family)
MTSIGSWTSLLDWAYDRVLVGSPGLETASILAQKYNRPGLTVDQQVSAIIRRQKILAGSSGFITGLGGFMTLPVAIPANIASVVFIQMRMIAAIAHVGGYDLEDRKVRSMVYTCLAGNAAKDILQEAGIKIGKNFTRRLISSISERSLVSINQKVGFALLRKSGERGLINISKAVPLAGGIIGGTFDVVTTGLMGKLAHETFIKAA